MLAALLVLAAPLAAPLLAQRTRVAPPAEVLGFAVGADRTLADWGQITGYFQRLARTSAAVAVDTLGTTTQGRPFIVATISTPENVRRREAIRRTQARLADPRGLGADEERRIAATQPAVILISCNIHATEIGSSQMAMELAWRLATNDTLQRALRDVVVLLIPSANPDGQQMVTEWYRTTLGTPYEGGPLPWLYHAYVGHDNNRDWYMVTQQETKLVTDFLYRRWFPAVVYDVHQMGSEGFRIFVPPMVDPVNPNLDPLIVRGINLIGAHMSFALQQAGKRGVGDGVLYDLWWHGGFRSTPTRHNMIALLTEAASVRVATPIVQEGSQLRGHARGYPRNTAGTQYPDPWTGGTWRLRDIVDYELVAAEALVGLAGHQRGEFVRGFAAMGRRQIALGASTSPRAFVIPKRQRDAGATATLVDVLQAGGVEVRDADSAFVVRLDQPYRAHAKDLLEPQRFPAVERWPGGPVERPYDVAGWTLPFQMGVDVRATDDAPAGALLPRGAAASRLACAGIGADAQSFALDARNVDAYRGVMRALRAGTRVEVDPRSQRFVVHAPPASLGERRTACALPLRAGDANAGARTLAPTLARAPRVALYRPWTASMDEGWTRWLFERFDVPFVTLTDSMVKGGALRDRFDAIVVPDMSLREVREGMPPTQVPPRYAGGLGAAGIAELARFVERGGTLVLLDHASELAEAVGVRDVSRITVPSRGDGGGSAGRETLYAPGSILRVLVDRAHPLALGMADSAAIYFTNSVTFDVAAGSSARVVLRYPPRADDILMSGFLSGADAIAGKAAAVEAPVGGAGGRVVMFGFRPQYRGQSYGTFSMLFNALLGGAAPAGAVP